MRGFRNGLRHIHDTCPHMRAAAGLYGNPKSRKREPGFATLVRIIIDQQVSVQAGAAIWSRLETAAGTVTPDTVLRLGETSLRDAGLSGAQARCVYGIARAIDDCDLNLDRLQRGRPGTVLR